MAPKEQIGFMPGLTDPCQVVAQTIQSNLYVHITTVNLMLVVTVNVDNYWTFTKGVLGNAIRSGYLIALSHRLSTFV